MRPHSQRPDATGFPSLPLIVGVRVGRWLAVSRGVVRRLAILVLVALTAGGCMGDHEVPEAPALTGGVEERGEVDGARITLYRDTLPACRGCSIRLIERATLGSLDDPFLVRTTDLAVARDSRGRTYLADRSAARADLILYDREGRVVRSVGREGQGPGEFTSIHDLLVGAGDTLYVLHSRGLAVFDSSGTLDRAVRLEPAPSSSARLVSADGDSVLLTAWYRTPGLREYPFHRFDADGRHVGGFGPWGVGEFLSGFGLEHPTTRYVGSDPDDATLWMHDGGGFEGYRIENLEPDVGVTRIVGLESAGWRGMAEPRLTQEEVAEHVRARLEPLDRGRDWTAPDPQERIQRSGPEGPPTTSTLSGIQPLGDGRVLVTVRVPGRNWDQDRFEWDLTFPDDPRLMPGSVQHMNDTVLDIIDVRTGGLLVRAEVAGTVQVAQAGTLYRIWVDEMGLIQVVLYELEDDLEGAPGG